MWDGADAPPLNAAARPTADAVARFLNRPLARKTRERYRYTLGRLAAAFSVIPTDPDALQAYLNTVTGTAHTRDAHFRDVRAFLAWTCKRSGAHSRAGCPAALCQAAALIERPRVPRADRRVLTEAEVRTLLRIRDRRDRALVAFILDTGARIHEVAGVRRHHIITRASLDGAVRYSVALRGAEGMSKTGARNAPLSAAAVRLLTGVGDGDLIWTARTGSRFGTHEGAALTVDGLKRAVRRITAAAIGRAVGPHVLRHTMATMYIRNGGDIESLRRILGHADIRTTAHYLQLVTDDLEEKHAAFSPVARQG